MYNLEAAQEFFLSAEGGFRSLTILLDKQLMKSFKNINILIKVKLFVGKSFFSKKFLFEKRLSFEKKNFFWEEKRFL